MLESHFNGNSFTKSMHEAVERELKEMHGMGVLSILNLFREKTVLLQKNGSTREGRFDFLVETPIKLIGFEVLTRPTKGKLKKKLVYANEADEFVFVLPKDSLAVYKKTVKGPRQFKAKKRFLGKEFGLKNLGVWLFDEAKNEITERHSFQKIFNICP